ncbi:MAG: hypothetical protein RR376_01050, partial [Janthinobacterium sp.]
GVALHAADLDALVHPDEAGRLAGFNQEQPDGLFLVRPDGHIAWRHAHADLPQADELSAIFASLFHLGLPARAAALH